MENESMHISMASSKEYLLFNNSGTAEQAESIHEPCAAYGKISEYIETVRVQPGMLLNIIKIPADREFQMDFEIKDAPFTFECWLQGAVEYFYEDTNNIKGSDKVEKGCIIFGSAVSERGFCYKPKGCAVEFVQLAIDPVLLQITLENTLINCSLKSHNCLNRNNQRHRFVTAKIPETVMSVAKNISECSQEQPFRNIMLASKAQELFYNIVMELFLTSPECRKCSIQPEDIKKFYFIKDMIERNLDNPLSHSQIAREAGINEFKLKTGFKELFGKTVYGYIIEKRMKSAKSMLETGTKSVSSVAWDMGYTNVSHFISVFRKHYGMTPGKFLGSIKHKQTYNQKSSV